MWKWISVTNWQNFMSLDHLVLLAISLHLQSQVEHSSLCHREYCHKWLVYVLVKLRDRCSDCKGLGFFWENELALKLWEGSSPQSSITIIFYKSNQTPFLNCKILCVWWQCEVTLWGAISVSWTSSEIDLRNLKLKTLWCTVEDMICIC